ncbi:AAA family ATPase [Lysobacter sp. CFH 32150]|uniref:ATP-binding protein n=1 Tax=Lysobacter sp. CFH 32150 TaxID=2927128 RepID=UPI001FA7AC90|nr:AAA family ATPase [Lysobacter sp. CFH 32150]MCI4567213.1 AAA family ATPase [Lysobacter sp. CFH 32150]
MTSRSHAQRTKGAERAPKSQSKSPADAATSNGAATKPGKGSNAKRNPARAQLHHNGDATPVERVLARLGDFDREGDGWLALCPAHNDSKPSLRISEGDDGRALLTCRANCATDRIIAKLGITLADLFPATPTKSKPKKRTVQAPKPRATRKPKAVKEINADEHTEAMREAKRLFPKSSFAGYKLAALYPYRRADGSVWCWRWRFEHAAEDKEIGPFHFDGGQWVAKEPKPPRAGKPLYRLPELLASDGPIIVVEGEKCADALAALGIVATTSGSSSTAKSADWSPLAGREVRIWPDNDDAGDRYAAEVAAKLADLGCDLSLIDVQALDLPNKGDDAADWLTKHRKVKAADVLALPTVEPETDEDAPTVQLICAADIQPKSIQWLWKGWLARGMLHILAGDGGTGKTTAMLSVAAAITKGGKLPDGSTAPVGNVLIWTGEDDVERVLVPRLAEAGADRRRVFVIRGVDDGEGSRPFDPSADMRALELQAGRIGNVAMVLVDPIVNAVTGDSHKNAEVRRGLQPLVDLGSKLQAAIVGITHFAKNTEGRKTTDRIIGSVAYTNFSRVALATVKGRGGECRLVRCKSNIGPDGDGFSYSIDIVQREYDGESNDVSRIEWGAPLYGYASELLDQVEAKKLARDEAADWLSTRLADGPVAQKDLAEQAKADGVAWRTVERAKETLSVMAYPERSQGKGRGNGRWMWELPRSRGVTERRKVR